MLPVKRALNWLLDVGLGILLLVFFWIPACRRVRKAPRRDEHEMAGV